MNPEGDSDPFRQTAEALSLVIGSVETCCVSGCTEPIEFDHPRVWCRKHWTEWFYWPQHHPGEPEPDWMPDLLGEHLRLSPMR